MEFNRETISTVLSIAAGYVALGIADSLYCRVAADDSDSSGGITGTEYDAYTATGIHRLFAPIHTMMKGVYAVVWPFEAESPESS